MTYIVVVLHRGSGRISHIFTEWYPDHPENLPEEEVSFNFKMNPTSVYGPFDDEEGEHFKRTLAELEEEFEQQKAGVW